MLLGMFGLLLELILWFIELLVRIFRDKLGLFFGFIVDEVIDVRFFIVEVSFFIESIVFVDYLGFKVIGSVFFWDGLVWVRRSWGLGFSNQTALLIIEGEQSGLQVSFT